MAKVDGRVDRDSIIIKKSMFTHISFHLALFKRCPFRMRSQVGCMRRRDHIEFCRRMKFKRIL